MIFAEPPGVLAVPPFPLCLLLPFLEFRQPLEYLLLHLFGPRHRGKGKRLLLGSRVDRHITDAQNAKDPVGTAIVGVLDDIKRAFSPALLLQVER